MEKAQMPVRASFQTLPSPDAHINKVASFVGCTGGASAGAVASGRSLSRSKPPKQAAEAHSS
jgi:hypothetical protein